MFTVDWMQILRVDEREMGLSGDGFGKVRWPKEVVRT